MFKEEGLWPNGCWFYSQTWQDCKDESESSSESFFQTSFLSLPDKYQIHRIYQWLLWRLTLKTKLSKMYTVTVHFIIFILHIRNSSGVYRSILSVNVTDLTSSCSRTTKQFISELNLTVQLNLLKKTEGRNPTKQTTAERRKDVTSEECSSVCLCVFCMMLWQARHMWQLLRFI